MTAGEQLLIYSSLSGPNTAEDHFLAINFGSGGGGNIYRVAPFYEVRYIGESKERVFYVAPIYSRIKYVIEKKQTVAFVSQTKIKISYKQENKIKIRVLCH
jgi:hypothetical protein